MADCLFCAIVSGAVEADVVLETEHVVGFLDVRPVFKGHTLLVPREHVVTLPDLPAALRDPFLGAAQRVSRAVVDALGAQGSFVAMNNTVSQSVAHLHLHVVPRTKGDGLRGFFWPRTRYDDDADRAEYATRLRAALRRAEVAMGWWVEQVVPRAVDLALGNDEIGRLRRRTCAGLRGRLLEIGFGSGLNVRALPRRGRLGSPRSSPPTSPGAARRTPGARPRDRRTPGRAGRAAAARWRTPRTTAH